MRTIDPRDPGAVSGAVIGWATARFGGSIVLVGSPVTIAGGFDSYIHALSLRGRSLPAAWQEPLVVRVLPSADRADQAAREAAIQGWSAAAGYPTPRVLAVLGPDDGIGLPVQIMERAPGTTLLEAVTRRPWRAFGLVDLLAALALRLHALPTDGWPGPASPAGAVDQRLSLPRRVVDELDTPDLAAGLDRAEGLAPDAIGTERIVCHGDFHPLNVLVDGERASVIDWTDAALGPREADVSRTLLLFELAAIAVDNRVARAALDVAGPRLARRYRRAYEAGATLDPVLLRRWEVLHTLHGWAQVVMLGAGGFDGESSSDPTAVPTSVVSFLRGRFESAAAAAGI